MTYNALLYREWILHETGEYTIEEKETKITLHTALAYALISFYDEDIVELSVTDKEKNETGFYLHFQAHNKAHAEELFHEMVDTLISLSQKKTLKITLTCTSGLTTSFFAMKLNEMAAIMGLDYHFDAVGFSMIVEEGKDVDVILMAPQIGYEYEKLQKIFTKKIVMKIPAQVFAGYKASEMITLIHETIKENEKNTKTKEEPVTIREVFDNELRILTIGVILDGEGCRIPYRIYDHGKVTLDKEVRKADYSVKDLDDLLEYVMVRHVNIDAISIAMPGVTDHGTLTDVNDYENHENFAEKYMKKYHIPVLLCNDVNAMALGYYALNEDCENMLFYWQPMLQLVGGFGIIMDGRLRRGYHSYAGELTHLLNTLMPNGNELCKTVEGMEEIVKVVLTIYISTLAPEKIILFSPMTPDVLPIKAGLQDKLGPDYIPPIIHAKGLKKYMLPGLMIYGLEALKHQAGWSEELKKHIMK